MSWSFEEIKPCNYELSIRSRINVWKISATANYLAWDSQTQDKASIDP